MRIILLFVSASFFWACSVSKQLQKSATENVLSNATLQTAHVGISIYEPASGKYWFNYQGDKYFVPASNTKLATCYAAMKYLGDSLVGLRYGVAEKEKMNDWALIVDAAGDPTFMHKDFHQQPVMRFFETQLSQRKELGILFKKDKIERWGSGWSWNDYESSYMAERSKFPAFGNVVSVELNDFPKRTYMDSFLIAGKKRLGKVFKTSPSYFDSLINQRLWISLDNALSSHPRISIQRDIASNTFISEESETEFYPIEIPYVTNEGWTALNIIGNTIGKSFASIVKAISDNEYNWVSEDSDIPRFKIKQWNIIHSQPTDSLLKPMMHRSDNFFAEQALLMVSNEHLGFMNDEKIIDTILKTDFNDLPQKPRWVDGSGLSRYNLFSPQDFVAILNKMKNEFGMPRIKNILATGGEGTISNYYVNDKGFIYAKTGTLSGVVALSGFLYTKKGKELIFSVLVNNHQGSATEVRRAVEKFIEGVREKY